MSDDSAFPHIEHNGDFADSNGDYLNLSSSGGLSKRELFAAMIAQGIAARGPIEGEADPSIEVRCRHAVLVADALLAALAKREAP